MDAAPLQMLLDAFAGDRHTFLYSGQFLDAHTARLISLGEAAVGQGENNKATRARLAFVLVEAYQNIIRHVSRPYVAPDRDRGRSMILLRNWSHCNAVSTMNAVARSEVNTLVDALNDLDALDEKQLKTRYLETLQQQKRTKRGGAGLGLIEMKRRSGNALRHKLVELDADNLLFTLSATLNEKGSECQDLEALEQYHRYAMEGGVLMLCRGLETHGITASLFRMLEQEMAHDPACVHRIARSARAGMDLLSAMDAPARTHALGLLNDMDGYALLFSGELSEDSALELTAAINGSDSSDVPLAQNREKALRALRNSSGGALKAFENTPLEGRTRVIFTAGLAC